MTRYLILLRGINVGGRNKVPMAALRELLESHGHTKVSTYIAYPVPLEISTHSLGRGHAYTWGGNMGQPDDAITGSSPSGGTSVADYVAHYPCDRAIFSGDPGPSAL